MYFITEFFVLLFLISFFRDNRSLWNPALLLLSLLFSYMSIANLFYEAGQEEVHMIFFAGIFSPATSFSFSKWLFPDL